MGELKLNRSNKKKFWRLPQNKVWRRVVLSFIAVALLGLVYLIYQGWGIYSGINGLSNTRLDGKYAEDKSLKPKEWKGKERVNILIMGRDNRKESGAGSARSDSNIVVSIDPVTKKARIFSVLRDTYVDIEGHGQNRINTAVALGGPNLAMKTFGDFLGLTIQYYVYTDFDGFRSLVDELGGIDIYVDKTITDRTLGEKIVVEEGQQHLDGKHALSYVRFRKDAQGDFGRSERQRKFLMVVLDEVRSGWNVLKMKQIIDSISPYVQSNLEASDLLKLAQLGVDSQVTGSSQAPPREFIVNMRVDGAAVLGIKDPEVVHQFVQDELAKDVPVPATETTDNSSKSTEEK